MADAESAGRFPEMSWLGVTTGTIAQLAHRGTLAKHPDGGLVPADVIRYGETRRRA